MSAMANVICRTAHARPARTSVVAACSLPAVSTRRNDSLLSLDTPSLAKLRVSEMAKE